MLVFGGVQMIQIEFVARWVFPKIGFSPKMDGENHGTPYFLMDDLGVKRYHYFRKHPDALGNFNHDAIRILDSKVSTWGG